MMAFHTSKGFVAQQAGKNFPAPNAAVRVMEAHASMGRNDAMAVEAKGFAKVAKTPQATAMVGLFLADQAVAKANKKQSAGAKDITQAAVLGAGIMGGGIAHLSRGQDRLHVSYADSVFSQSATTGVAAPETRFAGNPCIKFLNEPKVIPYHRGSKARKGLFWGI